MWFTCSHQNSRSCQIFLCTPRGRCRIESRHEHGTATIYGPRHQWQNLAIFTKSWLRSNSAVFRFARFRATPRTYATSRPIWQFSHRYESLKYSWDGQGLHRTAKEIFLHEQWFSTNGVASGTV